MKTEFSKMYNILEKMLDATEKREINKIESLNRAFESLLSPLEKRTESDCEYDNCRQSFIMAAESSKLGREDRYEIFIKDAKERFDKIREKKK